MTNINYQNVRRALSAVLLFTLLLSMFGNVGPALKGLNLGMVSTASACQPDKPCADAPGQVAKTEEAPDESAPLVNNGGQTLPPQAVANGVANQPQNQPASEPVIANAPATEESNASSDTGLPGGTNNLPGVGNVNNNGQHNGSNPHIVDQAILESFLLTLSVECPYPSSEAAVDCWNHFVFNNVYTINGGNVHHDCRDTGNANNPMLKPNGGTVVKLSMLYLDVMYGRAYIGDPQSCSHGGPR